MAAQAATVPYNRTPVILKSTVHPEYRAAAAPLLDHRQPTGIALEQRVQLRDRLGYVTGNHHVARPLSLQLGTLPGGGRRGHHAPAVTIDIERHAEPAGVEPDEGLEVGRDHRVRGKGREPREHLAGARRDVSGGGAPRAGRETTHLQLRIPERHRPGDE